MGENEATNIEMAQWLNQDTAPAQKKRWWFWMIAASIIFAIGFVIYYLIQDGSSFETIITSAKYVFLALN